MKILHSSDWHLGKSLYTKADRHIEHRAFFDWLLNSINEQNIELLIVAGDIFDTSSPSIQSQKMYYDFLVRVRNTSCRKVIVVGGNHDSASFLNAPKDILAALDVTVVGAIDEQTDDEIIVVNDADGKPALIVCAVPFLRERDVSRFVEGEAYSDRSKRVNESIRRHYIKIAALAAQKREEIGKNIPIIATGHMSVGSKNTSDNEVRDTYIGNIEAVSADIFPETFEYVALGHYHIASAPKSHIRYCGSPIPMGFGEAGQTKLVYILEFNPDLKIESLEIPVFQHLESIKGDKEFIKKRIEELKARKNSIWIEVTYNGKEFFSNLSDWLDELTADSNIEVLKRQTEFNLQIYLSSDDTTYSLDELKPEMVFEKLLEKSNKPDDDRLYLRQLYNEILYGINNEA
jgi:DNA repair protein SbcD/Mre11